MVRSALSRRVFPIASPTRLTIAFSASLFWCLVVELLLVADSAGMCFMP
jgi:hypothetical protein